MPSLVFFSPGWYNPLIKTKGVRSMKRCLVLSDSFKGTLSSPDICRIARSLHIPGWHIDALPVADGGEGTTDCFLDACDGQRIALPVSGPFGGTIDGFYGLLPDGTAVVECAAAAGLHQAEGRLDPEAATTYGVGQLLAHALDHGAKRLILGLGGSCTNDGGCGAAAALGVRFYDRQGRGFVPTGGTLADIEAIDLSGRHPGLRPGVLTVMCDIDNPLYGETGAAYIFAPQKGANDACVQRLDAGLRHLAAVLHAQLGAEVDTLPGGGAAGGFGAGCAALLCGALRSGITTVLDTVDFDRRAVGCDLIVTGEGSFDAQSLGGKAISGVAGRCQKLRVPAAVLAGRVALTPEQWAPLDLRAVRSINPAGATLEDARANAAAYYRTALETLLKEWK